MVLVVMMCPYDDDMRRHYDVISRYIDIFIGTLHNHECTLGHYILGIKRNPKFSTPVKNLSQMI